MHLHHLVLFPPTSPAAPRITYLHSHSRVQTNTAFSHSLHKFHRKRIRAHKQSKRYGWYICAGTYLIRYWLNVTRPIFTPPPLLPPHKSPMCCATFILMISYALLMVHSDWQRTSEQQIRWQEVSPPGFGHHGCFTLWLWRDRECVVDWYPNAQRMGMTVEEVGGSWQVGPRVIY